MSDISVRNIVKSFEKGVNILDGLSFDILHGERVCLLGKNGAGKTTLLRLLTGEISEDAGDIAIAPGKRIGLISQIPVYPEGYTAEDVLKTAHERVYTLQARADCLAAEMERRGVWSASGGTAPTVGGEGGRSSAPLPVSDAALLDEYGHVTHELERVGGYSLDYERARVANGLDIPPSMLAQLFDSLSGGEKTRVNLARLILEDTDILLLDEPTNHLDLKATEWLEEYLRRFRGTVLAISHDRWFLDAVATRTIELTGGKAELYSGNYSFYIVEKQRRLDELATKYEREQKEIRRLAVSARRLHDWGTGNQALMKKSRAIEKRIERVRKTDRPGAEKSIHAAFKTREFHGDEVLLIEGVTKTFGSRKLFDVGELLVTAGERVAIIGENGAGKSTLLKIITGEELPDGAAPNRRDNATGGGTGAGGRVRLGPSVKTAYLPQHVSFVSDRLSALDTVVSEADVSPQTARNMLGAFKFSGDDVFKRVAELSGGEKSRLRLCILMRGNINLLILDEPTNHLDIQSREWIENALDDYGEALLFVSHDRYFIERFATRVLCLENGEILDFRGNFAEFREAREREAKLKAAQKTSPVKGEESPRQKNVSGAKNVEKQRNRLEKDIERTENSLSELEALSAEHASDYVKLMELDTRREELETELEALYEAWEALG